MTLPTKEELLGRLETSYLDFTERATKPQISAALKFLTDSPKAGARGASTRDALPGPVTKITLLDRYGYRTVLDLENHTLESPPLGRTYEDGVDTTGDPSSEIVINLSTLELYAEDVIEFDPRPDQVPIMISFEGTPFTESGATRKAPAEEEPAEEEPAEEEPTEEEPAEEEPAEEEPAEEEPAREVTR